VPRATARPVCEALALAIRRHGVPDQILTTTGKVERFHKTVRTEFLRDRTFASLEEAQERLDAWVLSYNEERPHQGIGMVPPAKRFALAAAEASSPVACSLDPQASSADAPRPPEKRLTRRVSDSGHISLCTFPYHVGAWLAGETVDIQLDDRLVQIFHRGVLVATQARRHPLDVKPVSGQTTPRRPRPRPGIVGVPVIRKVDPRGDVAFAGTGYRVGLRYARKDVEIHLVDDTVEIYFEGALIRTHKARHDRSKEHGAFGVPKGRPRKKKAS
jgi:hypothetical protein